VKTRKNLLSQGMSRRESMKLSGMALGGFALRRSLHAGNSSSGGTCPETGTCYPTGYDTQRYSYYYDSLSLPTMDYKQTPVPPGTPQNVTPPLESNEMRITFMGSCIPPVRRAQAMMSVFVEVGGGKDGQALDQAIFDCGSGCVANYGAAGVGFGRMDKIFINHLHGDHMSDMTHIYCFGPSLDRLSPLYVWGPGPSGVRSPKPPYQLYRDGTKAFCEHLREAWRWHSESFSFQNTSYEGYEFPTRARWGLPVDPVPVSDDPPDDGYALVPIQLDWREVGGVAYWNRKTGVKITHFPVIHCRRGSMGYKLEWNGLSMIYSSDTKPEYNTIIQAQNKGQGVDVLIHEMVVPPEIWAMESSHLSAPGWGTSWNNTIARLKNVQDSSHTPQGAFGYLLSQIHPRPRLTVATHFPVSDDTIACALKSVNKHCPDIGTDMSKLAEYPLVWSFDLMVIRVFAGNPKPEILRRRAEVLDYGFSPIAHTPPVEDLKTPKYHTPEGEGDPYAQIDQSAAIASGEDTYCDSGY
jgi:ribonuclease Z